MTEPATPLLTVEDLVHMVEERNALLTQANHLTSRIDHIRQFIGDDRFVELVGRQEISPPSIPAALVRSSRDGPSTRDVILNAVQNEPEGCTYDMLRAHLREAGLHKRSPTTFFNTISRMITQGEIEKVGERVFSPQAFANLHPDRVKELRSVYKGSTKVLIDVLTETPGLPPSEVVQAMAVADPTIKSNAVYAGLSRLAQSGLLRKDEDGRYWVNAAEG